MILDEQGQLPELPPVLELLLCSACHRVLAYQGADLRPQLMHAATLS